MQAQDRAAQRQHRHHGPFGDLQGRRYLIADEMGELQAISGEHSEEKKGRRIAGDGHHTAGARAGAHQQDVDAGVHTAVKGHRGPQKRHPDQEVAGQFLGPEKGMIEHVAAEDLGGHDRRHDHADAGQTPFNASVDPPADFQERHGRRFSVSGWRPECAPTAAVPEGRCTSPNP